MSVKYHEQVLRHQAVLADGRPCEILERLTFERTVLADGSLSEARQVNRRFDLKTGERVNHLGDDEFELDFDRMPLRRIATAT
jgi:hypothetical protein